MNIKDLQPASALSKKFGVKALVYGAPGTGKTPIIATAPKPVACIIEPGMLSMRKHNNVPCYEANTIERIEEFFKWIFSSNELKNFDTICIDSVSQLSELYLTKELKECKDGRKAYGNMSAKIIEKITALYYMKDKHVYLTAKQGIRDENGINTKFPYFPGNDLNIKVPHLYDEVLYCDTIVLAGQQTQIPAFRTKPSYGILARDRSGNLNEFEPTDLTALFAKCIG